MSNEPVQLDFKKYIQIIKRRKFLFILPALLLILAGSLYAFLLPPVYQSSATILIEVQEIPNDFVRSLVTSYAEHRIQIINQRLMSRSKLMEIINQFNLYAKMRGRKTIDEIIDTMRNDIKLDIVSRGDDETALAFRVSYQSDNPGVCQNVCNTISSMYLRENLETRQRQAQETSKFLDEEAQRLSKEIGELQKDLAIFKKEHIGQLPELMDLNLQTVMRLDNEIIDLENQIRVLQDRNAYFEGQLALIDPYTSPVSKPGEKNLSTSEYLKLLKLEYSKALAGMSPDHPDIKKMKRTIENLEKEVKVVDLEEEEGQLANLREQLANLRKQYTSQHPEVIRVEKEIAILEKERQSRRQQSNPENKSPLMPDNPAYINIQTQIATTELEIEAIKRERNEKQRQRDLYQRRIEMTPQIEKEYMDMKIRLTTAMSKYDDILKKLMEAKVSMGLEEEQMGERFTMIDPPNLPTKPFKPNRVAILMVFVVLGIGIGTGCGAGAEFIAGTIWSESDLQGTSYEPVLSIIPIIESKKEVKKRKWKWIIIALLTILGVALTLLLIHFFVMDIEILWIRVYRGILARIRKVINHLLP